MSRVFAHPPPRAATTRPRLVALFQGKTRQRARLESLALLTCAEAIGLGAGHYSNIEAGRVGPPDEPILVKLTEVLDLPQGALLARAGRLSTADLHRFWQSPLIPSLVMSSTGWTQEDANTFQEIILASLNQSTPA